MHTDVECTEYVYTIDNKRPVIVNNEGGLDNAPPQRLCIGSSNTGEIVGVESYLRFPPSLILNVGKTFHIIIHFFQEEEGKQGQ